MRTVFYLVPAGRSAGLTTVALGLVQALDRRGIPVGFYKPVNENPELPERSVHFLRSTTHVSAENPVPLADASRLLAQGRLDELLARVLKGFNRSTPDRGLSICEGLTTSAEDSFRGLLNQELIRALDGQVILVASVEGRTSTELEDQIESARKHYGENRVSSIIFNRVDAGGDQPAISPELTSFLTKSRVEIIGVIPANLDLTYCRAIDVQRHLQAEILHTGEMKLRRVKSSWLLARTVPNMLHAFIGGALLITPADRSDVIVAVSMAALSKVPLAGLILTGDTKPEQRVLHFCSSGFATGLPVFRVQSDSYESAKALYQLSPEVPLDDLERIRAGMDHVARNVDVDWLIAHSQTATGVRLSPAAFLYQLTERARAAQKTIVLPEGSEPRTIKAAAICAERKIARCILLGERKEIEEAARSQDVTLGAQVEIVHPASVRANYVSTLYELRKSKGLSREMAASQLEDNVVLGTVMLARGEVDGLVSGAVHSTANTIRPALQIIKTRAQARVVSSVFFMCLPEQILVYGDCAVIPDPDAETLADIGIQSADSAKAFGIEPRVAFISYSTGESGSGVDVDKVRAATQIAREQRPDLLIDGPLQYDAAFMPEVARTKAPDSPVAGRATVYVFPDLNTGNTTYKAVQRSANVISIGPMLQGLRKPVNDLSRGALVEDIVYTIALTVVQATQV